MKEYKVIFADLDGTIIDTISGDTFSKGIWDMRIKLDVLDAIKKTKSRIRIDSLKPRWYRKWVCR